MPSRAERLDKELLDALQSAAFDYFVDTANPANGLVPDTSLPGSPCSIAVIGFALSCYPIGVSRGWMSRTDAVERTLTTLRFFDASPQGAEPDVAGFKGFYYHFLDMRTGLRVWQCELSLIDTSLLLAGILTSGCYYTGNNEAEREIRRLVDALYQRTDWNWARDGEPTVSQGWRPESGFIRYRWQGYSEASILYVLALASPTHPLHPDSFQAWSLTYQWERIYGSDCLYAGPLFIHLFSHAWIDFRGIRDAFCAARVTDYFENTRHAIRIQRHYARLNPNGFAGYSEDLWGLTACDGPEGVVISADELEHRLMGYSARGVPYGPDDGTIAPWVAIACVPFEPEAAIAATRTMIARFPKVLRESRFVGSFNPSLATGEDAPEGWVSASCYGLDQGLLVMMIENYRTGLIWQLMRNSPTIRSGLGKAGFHGGWLQ
jgi:hypothetical protein